MGHQHELKETDSAPKRSIRKRIQFCHHPKFIPKLDIISAVEADLRTVCDKAASHIARSKVSEVLKPTKQPQRNITQEKKQTLKELKQDENIVILKADKGKLHSCYKRLRIL